MRPRPVSAVEVHAQPAAVGGARRAAPARPPRRLSLEVTFLITFLKLSAKLYTSVFHHGLKVGELVRGTGPGRTPKRPGREPLSSPPRRRPGPSSEAAAARPQRHPPPAPQDGQGAAPARTNAGQGGRKGGPLLRHPEENSFEISIFDPIEITSGFHNSEPSHFAGLRCIPLSLLLCSQLSSQHRPPLPRDVLALFEYELFYGGTLNINIYKERMYGQFPMVSVGCPHLVNCPHKLVNGQKEEGGGPWGGGEGGLCCPPGTPSVSRCYGAARGFPVAGLQEARGPGSGGGGADCQPQPGHLCRLQLGSHC